MREQDLQRILSYINDIRYGSVTVIIQDGHVLQIEKNEKIRL
ncbi:MAG: YezD family protein [Clostridiales Family XIII bacterium]|nr:YezD family protein [Clostridiales Family XIII bacterium]